MGPRALGELCRPWGLPEPPRFAFWLQECPAQGLKVRQAGRAERLECRVLGKAGHGGCCEANLASIKASFRAAKPFPYVGLWELQSAGEGLAGRRAKAKWPLPRALHQPVVGLAGEWVPGPGPRAQGWRA